MTGQSDSPLAHAKRRSFRQIMEESSGRILRESLPSEWVIHGYAPDYGIDGAIEIFGALEELPGCSETLGESVLFQLKSARQVSVEPREIAGRYNVEKGQLREDLDETRLLEIVQVRLDTSELVTIESMGSGIVVLLLLVCLESERTYFLNLTDYIDKVLTPESPNWRSQTSKTIRLPARNILTPAGELNLLIRFYGARPKLMGLFNLIHFQWAELGHGMSELGAKEWKEMLEHFIAALLRHEVWDHPSWELLNAYKAALVKMSDELQPLPAEVLDKRSLVDFWFKLDAVGRTFEDVTREWGQPTVLGMLSSYPD